ncbi:unnamed protein product [Kuraishia capsulata CBS 1993]|uniref:Uncharacterized protein n=1 Tax=Kuraishia capsulata CBS 1993 TaxID=1382522 RepID=W6MF47_9ASCO|nr:uncharacterized protein KUCA_T00000219001 [Kuraishia capsulata CBS 1993]CDK24259.1 unnamed protein product [Kuraishia capsulata CBS 1993]
MSLGQGHSSVIQGITDSGLVILNAAGEETDEEDYDSDYTYDSDIVTRDAQAEWEENLVQLKTLLNFVLLPVIGKVLGRRFANSLWGAIAERIF